MASHIPVSIYLSVAQNSLPFTTFLSDGGHTENTALTALLYERKPLIMCVDCGADPDYQLADVLTALKYARANLGCAFDAAPLAEDTDPSQADWNAEEYLAYRLKSQGRRCAILTVRYSHRLDCPDSFGLSTWGRGRGCCQRAEMGQWLSLPRPPLPLATSPAHPTRCVGGCNLTQTHARTQTQTQTHTGTHTLYLFVSVSPSLVWLKTFCVVVCVRDDCDGDSCYSEGAAAHGRPRQRCGHLPTERLLL